MLIFFFYQFDVGKTLGMTVGYNPKDFPDKSMQSVLVEKSPSGWGFDYTFDCT